MYTNVVDGHTSLGDGFTYPDGGYTDPGDMTDSDDRYTDHSVNKIYF